MIAQLTRRSRLSLLGSLFATGPVISSIRMRDCKHNAVDVTANLEGDLFIARRAEPPKVIYPHCTAVKWERQSGDISRWNVSFEFSDGYYFTASVAVFDWWWGNLLQKSKADVSETVAANLLSTDTMGDWWCKKPV